MLSAVVVLDRIPCEKFTKQKTKKFIESSCVRSATRDNVRQSTVEDDTCEESETNDYSGKTKASIVPRSVKSGTKRSLDCDISPDAPLSSEQNRSGNTVKESKRNSSDSGKSSETCKESTYKECFKCGKRFIESNSMLIECNTKGSSDLCVECFSKEASNETTDEEEELCIQCFACDMPFSSESELVEHMHVDKNDEKLYTCRICNRSFQTKQCYSYHSKTHPAKTTYSCDSCDQVFFEVQNLEIHKIIHRWQKRSK